MRNVSVILLPGFSHLGLAAVTEPMFVANWLSGRDVVKWALASLDGQPAMTSSGSMVAVTSGLPLHDRPDSIFVLASFDAHRPGCDRRVLDVLRRGARFGAELIGIENGTLALAEAGVLAGRRAAVHWDNLFGFREAYPALCPVDTPWLRDGSCVTCAGGGAILDMMTAWLGWNLGDTIAGEVADHLLPGRRQAASAPSPTGDPVITRARALMRANLDDPISCAAIARALGLSLRQLERRFLRHTGRSPVQDYLLIRLECAHQLLQQTGVSVTAAAIASGFSSAAYFSRVYRATFGCAPSHDRQQSVTAPVLRRYPARG